MSNSSNPAPNQSTTRQSYPRAIIHKQILDRAESSPSASMEEVARDVSGASVSLVERVLGQYGDPGTIDSTVSDDPGLQSDDHETESGDRSTDSMSDKDTTHTFDNAQLSEKQLTTLHSIYEHPEATQREIAAILDVSSATVCNRVNNIEGFDWRTREEFVTTMFEDNGANRISESTRVDPTSNVSEDVSELAARLEDLETRMDGQTDNTQFGVVEPELLHKVVHACMSSEHITEEEELRILSGLLESTASNGERPR